MPFTEATVMKIQRVSNIAPIAMPHAVMQDTYVRGFLIPKDAVILANLAHCHQHPKYWKNPNEFCPERFIDAKGNVQYWMSGCVPFSAGKRVCLGEAMAKMELFLFITALAQKFKLEFDKNTTQPSFEPQHGMTSTPLDFNMCFKPIQ